MTAVAGDPFQGFGNSDDGRLTPPTATSAATTNATLTSTTDVISAGGDDVLSGSLLCVWTLYTYAGSCVFVWQGQS